VLFLLNDRHNTGFQGQTAIMNWGCSCMRGESLYDMLPEMNRQHHPSNTLDLNVMSVLQGSEGLGAETAKYSSLRPCRPWQKLSYSRAGP
jgi:hypothetical protein